MDSIMNNLRSDFCGRGELAERQQRLGQLMARLRKVGRGGWREGRRAGRGGGQQGSRGGRRCVPGSHALSACWDAVQRRHALVTAAPQVSEEFNVAVVITNQVGLS